MTMHSMPETIEDVSELLLDIDKRLDFIEGIRGGGLSHSKLKDTEDHKKYLKSDGTVKMRNSLDMGLSRIINSSNRILDVNLHSGDVILNETNNTLHTPELSATLSAHVADGTIHFTEASIDHGSIAGLEDAADHAYAFLHAGTRAMTGNLDVGDFNITNVGDISLDTISDDAGIENTLSIADLNTAYDHSQDNTQAHTDYLINNGNDTTSGKLTASGGFDAGDSDITNVGKISLDEIGADGSKIIVADLIESTGDIRIPNTDQVTAAQTNLLLKRIGTFSSDPQLEFVDNNGDVAGRWFTGSGAMLFDAGTEVARALLFRTTSASDISFQTNTGGGGGTRWKILSAGNLEGQLDNQKILFGAGQNASVYHSGTDMFINPKEVGVGVLRVLGGAVFNQGLEDVDFIIGGDTEANLFRVDAGTDSVRLGDWDTHYTKFAKDGTMTQHGTARIDWTKITANAISFTDASTSDSVSDLQTAFDGNILIVSEGAPSGGSMIVDFINVLAFNWVRSLCSYDGSSSHAIPIRLYNWITTNFDMFAAIQDGYTNSGTVFEEHDFFVPSDTNYIGTGGNAGKVRVKYDHAPSGGNASHKWYYDEVALYQ